MLETMEEIKDVIKNGVIEQIKHKLKELEVLYTRENVMLFLNIEYTKYSKFHSIIRNCLRWNDYRHDAVTDLRELEVIFSDIEKEIHKLEVKFGYALVRCVLEDSGWNEKLKKSDKEMTKNTVIRILRQNIPKFLGGTYNDPW
ncbi:hypothetical protein HN789_06045 [archaeon]|jgi:hypothetical protein|nr:hypothetical protein [archaeon]MBT4022331.1 hypothetical protein [archaeon]MBT4273209.1 hypothetical protein [archaeon]MBT4461348.1 hypothetical protein [archaeon]MBT4858908.1 hypothetical protein [archaeon]